VPVRIGSVLDGRDRDGAGHTIDAVDHPVVATPGAVQLFRARIQRLAYAVGVCRQGAAAATAATGLVAGGQDVLIPVE
jgi:hypothetical protein